MWYAHKLDTLYFVVHCCAFGFLVSQAMPLKIIIDIPTDLQLSLFTVWINAETLLILDSAWCNKTTRLQLLDLYHSKSFVLEGMDATHYMSNENATFNTWTKIKHVKVRKRMFVWDELNQSDEQLRKSVVEYDMNRTVNLQFVGIRCATSVAINLINSCMSLQKLVLYDVDQHTKIFPNICKQILSQIDHLNIWTSTCKPVTSLIVDNIVTSCVNLSHLSLRCSKKIAKVSDKLCALIKSNPNLTSMRLKVEYCNDSILFDIACLCKNIKIFHFENDTANISLEGVLQFRQKCASTLTEFHVECKRDSFFSSLKAGERVLKLENPWLSTLPTMVLLHSSIPDHVSG
jgi:hypothetical protein